MSNRSIRAKRITDKERQTEKKVDGDFEVESFVTDINADRSPKSYGATYTNKKTGAIMMGFGDTRKEAEDKAKANNE